MKGGTASIHVTAWARLLRTHKDLIERTERHLQGADALPLDWYDVLWELEQAPQNRLRLSDLGERIALSRSNLSRLCDRLERAGLVRREPSESDGRGLYAVLTAEGARRRKATWPVYRAAIHEHFSSHIDKSEAALLASLLHKIGTNKG